MFSKSNIVFYTVMMFNEEGKYTSLNGLSGTYLEKLTKHVNMCDLLCTSLSEFGYKHRIFTNSINQFRALSSKNEIYDQINHLDLSEQIDNSIAFYLAMHKLVILEKIKNNDEYSIIIDHDCVMINDLPLNYLNAINEGISTIYQITNQVLPAYGLKNIMNDVVCLNAKSNLGLWFGGEIFGGRSMFFKDFNFSFSQSIKKLNSNIEKLNHCGDENILTNFIQEQMLAGRVFFDVGQAKIFSRFWSCTTLHFPEHWSAICNSSILHLPGDKDFLSRYYKINKVNFNSSDFISNYKKYLFDKGYQLDIDFFHTRKSRWFTNIITW